MLVDRRFSARASGVQSQKKPTSDQLANEKFNWQGFKTLTNNVLLSLRISTVSRESNSTVELTLMWMYVALYIETEAPELQLKKY